MKTFLLLLSGGVVTSLAEYFLNYNLIDLLKDKIIGLFSKLFGEAKAAESDGVAEAKAELAKLRKKS